MKHYLKIFANYVRAALIQYMEFRLNFIIWLLVSLFWAGSYLLTVEWIFGQVQTIAGWTKPEALLLVSISLFFVSCLNAFIIPSLEFFSDSIRQGELDFYLLKPVNIRFLMSVIKFDQDSILNNTVYIVLVFYFLAQTGIAVSLLNLVAFLLMIIFGLVIFYSLFYIIATTSFWFINVSNMNFLFSSILDAGRFPVQIFNGGLKVIFYYILPVGFVATFPAQALMGKLSFDYFISSFLIAIAIFILSQKFWNFALKHYSSASS